MIFLFAETRFTYVAGGLVKKKKTFKNKICELFSAVYNNTTTTLSLFKMIVYHHSASRKLSELHRVHSVLGMFCCLSIQHS